MQLEFYLQKIGLSEKEARVYLAGLQIGPATMQELVNAAKLKRATVYDVIESLKAQGLVKTIMKGRRRTYLVEDPQNLFSLLKQKENVVSQIFSQLLALQNTEGKRPSVRVYQGIEGIKEIYNDLVVRRSNFIEIISAIEPDKRIIKYWATEHAKLRVKKGSFVRVIAPDIPLARELQKKDKFELRETRILPLNQFPFQNEFFVYRNKVAFVTQEGDNSLGLVVESKPIAQTMGLLLESVWNSIKN